MEFSGRTILISGGTKGIGRATVKLFLSKGCNVAFTGRDAERVKDAERGFVKSLKGERSKESDAKSNSDRVLGIAADVRRWDDCQRTVKETVERFGNLDFLVNNAGIGYIRAIQDMTKEEWLETIETNLNGPFYLSHAALPYLMKQGGHIVNIGSLASKNTFKGGAAYCASKFGLLGFSECMMLDIRESNVKVTTIMPGSVATDFGDHSGDQSWKVKAEDVAQAIFDVINTGPTNMVSRVEMRPTIPKR